MSSNPSLLKWGGFCSVVFGLLHALSYIAEIAGIGYPPAASSGLKPFQVASLYSNPGFGISLLITWLSFLFLFPAMIGVVIYLWNGRSGFSAAGFLFGLASSITLMLSNFIRLGVSSTLVSRQRSGSAMLEGQAVFFHTLTADLGSFIAPMTGLFYLLWGLGFRKGPRPDRIVGASFLLAFLFLTITRILFYMELPGPANIVLMLRVLMVSAAFILTGRLLRKEDETSGDDGIVTNS
jgi:hypothetical protein